MEHLDRSRRQARHRVHKVFFPEEHPQKVWQERRTSNDNSLCNGMKNDVEYKGEMTFVRFLCERDMCSFEREYGQCFPRSPCWYVFTR